MKSPRKPIPRYTEMPRSSKPMKRGGRVKPVNRDRRDAEFARCYHSIERVEWVKSLPSVVSGLGPCVNAHTVGGGAGRKAGYETIVPLTDAEHDELHRIGVKTFGRRHNIDLTRAAVRTENAWRALHPMTAVGEIVPVLLPSVLPEVDQAS